MRGTLEVCGDVSDAEGNTPAYAGNTFSPALACPQAWEHSRVCGEHKLRIELAEREEGTPPRMRGTLILR